MLPRLLASAPIAMALPLAVAAQPVLELRPTCTSCRVALEDVVAFQADWISGGLPARPNGVQRFARDRWVVLGPDAGLPIVFDARGRYERALGRRGAGPGECVDPTLAFAWRADSTAIFDAANARMSIFDPDGRLIRAERWDGGSVWHAMRVGDRGFLVSPEAPLSRPAPGGRYRLPAQAEDDGTLWTVEARQPVLRRFRVGGEVLESWELPMRGFEPFTTLRGKVAQGAEFFVIEQTVDGLLLVGMVFPDPRSSEALGAPRTVDGVAVAAVDDWGRFVNTRFFVLDPRRRTLVAQADEEAWVAASLGEGLFWGIRPGGDGGRLAVLRAILTP